jgi:hypothetical protein
MSKEQLSPELEELKIKFEGLFIPGFTVLGHGTTQIESAEKTFETGLESKIDDIHTTMIPLNKTEEGFDQILNWPHGESKYIVVVCLPNANDAEMGGSRYFNSYFKELSSESTGYNNRYTISPKYVRGYFDMLNLRFSENQNFDPEKLSPTSPGLKESDDEPTSSELNIPQSSKDENSTEVW